MEHFSESFYIQCQAYTITEFRFYVFQKDYEINNETNHNYILYFFLILSPITHCVVSFKKIEV